MSTRNALQRLQRSAELVADIPDTGTSAPTIWLNRPTVDLETLGISGGLARESPRSRLETGGLRSVPALSRRPGRVDAVLKAGLRDHSDDADLFRPLCLPESCSARSSHAPAGKRETLWLRGTSGRVREQDLPSTWPKSLLSSSVRRDVATPWGRSRLTARQF